MRQAWLGLSGWVVAGIVLLAGAGRQDEVRCRRLVVEDGEGRPGVVLGTTDGRPDLEFLDRRESPRIQLMLLSTGQPAIRLLGEDDRNGIVFGVGNRDTPILHVTRDGEKLRRVMMEPLPDAPR